MKQTQIGKRKEFLKYVKNLVKPDFVYYPASGGDNLPKKIFGKNHVIHLTLHSDKQNSYYFKRLGEAFMLLGDMRQSPLADNSVDLIWLRLHGVKLESEMINDFDRILKPVGHIAIEEGGYNYNTPEKQKILLSNFSNFKKIKLPPQFKAGQQKFGIKKDDEEYGKYVKSKEAMMDFVTSHKNYTGFEEILVYALFKKD